jgi:hypothetical protein
MDPASSMPSGSFVSHGSEANPPPVFVPSCSNTSPSNFLPPIFPLLLLSRPFCLMEGDAKSKKTPTIRLLSPLLLVPGFRFLASPRRYAFSEFNDPCPQSNFPHSCISPPSSPSFFFPCFLSFSLLLFFALPHPYRGFPPSCPGPPSCLYIPPSISTKSRPLTLCRLRVLPSIFCARFPLFIAFVFSKVCQV